jgi:23S rRNA (adenine2503-C2)-methyltransferase
VKKDLLSLSKDDLIGLLKQYSEPKFRAKQLRDWLVKRSTSDFDDMLNIPKDLRDVLQREYEAYPLKVEDVQYSEDGTIKFASRTLDDEIIETVVMKYHYGYSVCVSSQIGCAMECVFCASAKGGLVRNLTENEILAQILLAQQLVNDRVGHVVFMGMGEPLNNYANLVKFLEQCRDEDWGLVIGMRNITISTSGLVPQIRKLADEGLQVTLAVSLHASNDKIRKRLLPIASKYSMRDIFDAGRYYTEKTGRRVTYEYLLIKDMNSSDSDASELAKLLKKHIAHINLIPYNPVEFLPWEAPSNEQVNKFANMIKSAGISVTIRRELGSDIDAACGQLRNKKLSK